MSSSLYHLKLTKNRRNLFEKILVPIDGSKQSHDALLESLEIAKIHGSTIEILHVITPREEYIPYEAASPNMPYEENWMPPEWINEYLDNVHKNDENMLKQAQQFAKTIAPDNNIITKLIEGRAADSIIEEAEKGDISLIIIGNRGLGGLHEFVLGSVSHEVVNKAKIPVLVIK
jgi:nucleotide-binding universal stress UspA family protein